MKSIGTLLKETRLKKRLTFDQIEESTKINKRFLEALESENWRELPEFPVVTGFVKNIATELGINPLHAVAFLRRDYPPQPVVASANPIRKISKSLKWSPRITFIVGVVVILALVGSYLSFQYFRFISPPALSLTHPEENQEVTQRTLSISGKTSPGAAVLVNNQPAVVTDEGLFQTEIEVNQDTKELEVKAISRSKKETTLKRKINVNFQ